MRTLSGTCTLNGRIAAGSGIAGNCACPNAIDGNKSNAASKSFPHSETLPPFLSNPVFGTLSHSSVNRIDQEKLGHNSPCFSPCGLRRSTLGPPSHLTTCQSPSRTHRSAPPPPPFSERIGRQ